MTTLPDKLIYPKPFAGGTGAVLTPFSDAVDGDKVNFETGFPSAYSTPKSNGGKFVTRGEMNYLGNLATKNEFYRMCGGINTFDPVFASKIGGYPKDAILDYFDGENFRKVISLKENNFDDFTQGHFDNWRIIGLKSINSEKVIINNFVNYTFPTSPYDANLILTFKAPRTGTVGVEIIRQERDSTSMSGFPTGDCFLGAGFLFNVSDNGEIPLTNINGHLEGWNILQVIGSNLPIGLTMSNTHYTPGNTAPLVKYGDIISICFVNGVGVQSNSATVSSLRNINMDFNIFML